MALMMSSEVPTRVKWLWAHVLRRAVFDYVLFNGVSARKLEWQRSFNYIFIEDQRYENGISFEEVCSLFGWDPDYLRRLTTKLTRSDIKRMETSIFEEEMTQDVIEAVVKESGRWKTTNTALPFFPRMVGSTIRMAEPKMVRKECLSGHVPLVQWQVAVA